MRSVSEWHGKTPDTAIPDRVKVRVFGRDNGRCKSCTRKCGVGGEPFAFDHVVSLVNGGQHSEGNLQLLCTTCHADKTRTDVAEKSRTYRKRKKHLGVRGARRTIPGRKFDGTPIPARWVRQ